jgi:hypothetical protein
MHRSVLALAALAASALPAQITHFSASLDGSQEVPPVVSAGRGWGIVKLDQSTNTATIFLYDTLTTATAAHLHVGAFGANGGILIGLSGGPKTWTGSGVLSAANVANLLAGNTYLNVHTGANPGGEIRGQVVLPKSSRYLAKLDAAQEVPPNPSTGTGLGVAFLHEPDNVLTYAVTSQGLTSAVTAAHIHQAPAGSNGSVIHPLNGSAGTYCGVTPKLTAAQLAALKASGLYFNIHTTMFPGGEIRGQILPFVADLVAPMDGNQEVPPVPTAAVGEACLTLNPDNTVTYRVTTSGVVGTAAHVHKAPAGVNGGVEFPLAGGPTVWAGTSPVLTASQINDARTGLWYVNVHSAMWPGGEIRGQVALAELPTTYGNGCPGSAGNIAEIGADGFACLGRSVPITLHGARPSTNVAALIGFDRDLLSGAVPLPIDLVLLNMPECFLLHDLAAPSLSSATDSRGCASANLAIPFSVSLRGLRIYLSWFIIDFGANALNVVTSNALSLRVQ